MFREAVDGHQVCWNLRQWHMMEDMVGQYVLYRTWGEQVKDRGDWLHGCMAVCLLEVFHMCGKLNVGPVFLEEKIRKIWMIHTGMALLV